jgi:hypothetical protein
VSATWPEALRVLATPPGPAGSGRERYGAAMTLWREGLVTPDVLEIYRIASPIDAQDPAPMLEAAGLPRPGTEIAALAAAAAALVAGLPGPGIAAVTAGFASGAAAPPAPARQSFVTAHLPAALTAMTAGAEPAAALSPRQRPDSLAAAIAAAAPWLAWTRYSYPAADIGPAFPRSHAFAPVVTGADFEAGLFLMAPGVLYRDHAHAAPELYVPFTGPHGWRFAPGAAFEMRPALAPVWNPPHQPHATRVGTVPFLGLYAWTADIDAPAYVLPAPDWADWEAP